MNKYLVSIVCILLFSAQQVLANPISPSCSYKGIPLYGRVKVVDSLADFNVRRVSSMEDLKVKQVSSFANSCGRWQFVDSFPDFTIKYVDSIADFSIRFVDSLEGI
ncbi:hypothetical protein HDR58_06910 [bacterium]|nr:hypothetical protein [bacterium]